MSSNNPKAHQHKRDTGRTDLAGEHPLGDAVQLVFLILFLVVWILDSFFLHYSDFLAENVAWYIRFPAGSIVLIGSYLMARSGLRTVFKEIRETPHVITEGYFSLVRHPIYLSALLLYMGLIICTFSLLSAALWLVIIIFYWYISRYEELLLINIFGEEYREYQKKVPMLFPFKLRRS